MHRYSPARAGTLALPLAALIATACGAPTTQLAADPLAAAKEPAMTAAAKVADAPASSEALALAARCKAHIASARGARDRIVALAADTAVADKRTATLHAFNALQTAAGNAEAESSLWRSVHPVESVRKAAETCEQQVAALTTELSLDRALYEAFAGLDLSGADPLATRLVTKTLEDFKRAGVDKDEATRKRIQELSKMLVEVGQEFSKTIIQDRRTIHVAASALVGLPQDWIDAHKPGPDGKVEVSTDYPDYIPFMTYSNDDAARRELYVTYRHRGWPTNRDNLQKILEIRHEMAQLLGYASWADDVTENKMIKSGKNAADFIDKVAAIAAPRMKEELGLLLAELRKTDSKATVVRDWQQAWLLNSVRKAKFDFDGQAMRPYLQYSRVRDGLLALTSKLFGIRYVKNTTLPVWHVDVSVYDVFEGDKQVGVIYLDMHPRDDKYKHAAQFTLTNGLRGVQLPAGVLVCNFPNPRDGNGLMEFKQVETFFHEFGHLLHHVLGGGQEWMRFSGVATEWDFVEAPSQIFEEWAKDYETLRAFAIDDKGVVIPASLVEKLRKSDELGKGLWVRHQMFYAAVSLGLHNRAPASIGDQDDFIKDQMKRYSPYPFVDGTHMQASFGHLNGYSAIYYTYMWSLVIAKDLYSAFEKAGIHDVATAMRYRKTILEPGGRKDAADLVRDFLGRPYSFDAFARWLQR